MSRSSIKLKAWIKALLIVTIVLLASGGGVIAPKRVYGWPVDLPSALGGFTLSIFPDVLHVVPGEGQHMRVFIVRSTGFTGEVDVSLVNPPSWVNAKGLVINPTASNGTMTIITYANATKGTTELTVQATTPGGITQTAKLNLKVVGTYSVTSKYGSAIFYETTKILDNDTATLQALVAYSNGTFRFSKSTTLLQSLERGDVIVIDPRVSSLAPEGLLRSVLSVRQEGSSVIVETRQAGLLETFLQLRVGVTNSTYSKSALSTGLRPLASTPKEIITPDFLTIPLLPPTNAFQIDPNAVKWNDLSTNLLVYPPSFGFGADLLFGLDIYVNWNPFTDDPRGYQVTPKIDYFEILLHAYEEAGTGIKSIGNLNVKYQAWEKNLGNYYTTVIPIYIGVWLHISIDLKAEVELSAQLNDGIDVSVDQKFDLMVGPKYCSADFCGGKNFGWQFRKDVTATTSQTTHFPNLAAGGGGSVKLSLGPELNVLLDSVFGQTFEVNPFLEVDAQYPHDPLFWLDGGIEGSVGVKLTLADIDDLEISRDFSLEIARFRIVNGPHFGPLVSITNPTPGSVLDLSTQGFNLAPHLTAKVTDPQGVENVCSESAGKSVAWTSSVNGQFATGCDVSSVYYVGILDPGVHQIYITATDSKGATSKSDPITVTLKYPSLVPVISQMTSPIYQGVTAVFQGLAYWTNDPTKTPIPCNNLSWTGPAGPMGQGCTAQVTFSQGQASVTLVATVGKVSATTTMGVTVLAQPTVLPPQPKIVNPMQQGLPGSQLTPGPGCAYGCYYATYGNLHLLGTVTGNYATVTWQAQWPCSDIPCSTAPQFSYTIAGTLDFSWNISNTLCTNPNFKPQGGGGTILTKIVLTATDANGNSGSTSVVINLGCVGVA